jgi:hypothetical protein
MALRFDSTDVDANMALLAELSLKAHQRPGTSAEPADALWEAAYLKQLAVIRKSFLSYPDVAETIAIVFDSANMKSVDPTWKAASEKLRRVGYATFRWKEH